MRVPALILFNAMASTRQFQCKKKKKVHIHIHTMQQNEPKNLQQDVQGRIIM